jgi:hypothetical protein
MTNTFCDDCTAKLRAIRDRLGVAEMVKRVPQTLCPPCFRKLPGYRPGARCELTLKGKPS